MHRAALIATLACAFAQSPGKWLIRSVNVDGNHIFPAAAVLAVAEVKPGETVDVPALEAACARLTASGAFETAGYKVAPATDRKGFIATFLVTETPVLYPAKFEDLGAADTQVGGAVKARDPLFSMEHVPAGRATLDRYAAAIEEYLAQRGIRETNGPVKVIGDIDDDGNGQLAAIFRPARDVPAVATIAFEGNRVFTGSELRVAIAPAAVGSPYTERRFRDILQKTVRPVYEARGLMRVSFPEVRAEAEPEVKGVHVVVTVNEGDVYNLQSVSVAQPAPLPESELLRAVDLKTGGPADFDAVNAGQERAKAEVRRAGYLDAKVTAERIFDDPHKTVSVVFHVDAGPRYTMGKLTIQGLDLEGEAAVKRMWTLKPGDPFQPEYPDKFLETVRAEAMFDHLGKTASRTEIDPKTYVVDVALSFAVTAK
jgi:outer membrane protein insertion porin family